MTYKILSASSTDKLEQRVTEWAIKGWQPQGGLATSANGTLMQAMVPASLPAPEWSGYTSPTTEPDSAQPLMESAGYIAPVADPAE